MKPTQKNVLIERVPGAKLTSTGIILKSTLDPDRGKILAIGPEVAELEVEEEVFLDWNKAKKIEGLNREMYMVSEDDVVFVYEDA